MKHPFSDDILLKKLNVLAILRDESEEEALRLYPELQYFIEEYKHLPYEQAKSKLLKETNSNLVLR